MYLLMFMPVEFIDGLARNGLEGDLETVKV